MTRHRVKGRNATWWKRGKQEPSTSSEVDATTDGDVTSTHAQDVARPGDGTEEKEKEEKRRDEEEDQMEYPAGFRLYALIAAVFVSMFLVALVSSSVLFGHSNAIFFHVSFTRR